MTENTAKELRTEVFTWAEKHGCANKYLSLYMGGKWYTADNRDGTKGEWNCDTPIDEYRPMGIAADGEALDFLNGEGAYNDACRELDAIFEHYDLILDRADYTHFIAY